MKYDPIIIKCLFKACESIGRATFADEVCVTSRLIGQILDGTQKGCKDDVWARMYPALIRHGELPSLPEYTPCAPRAKAVNARQAPTAPEYLATIELIRADDMPDERQRLILGLFDQLVRRGVSPEKAAYTTA